MSWLDIVIVAIVALSAGFGLLRGFVREVAALLVWALAFMISIQQAAVVSTYMQGITDSPTVHLALAFITLFVGIVVIGSIATRVLVKLVTVSGLGGTDRMLGLLFGALRGTLIVALAVVLAGLTPLTQEKAWEESGALNSVKPLICRAGADGWLAEIGSRAGEVGAEQKVPFEAELPAYWSAYCAQNNPKGVDAKIFDGIPREEIPEEFRDYLPKRDK